MKRIISILLITLTTLTAFSQDHNYGCPSSLNIDWAFRYGDILAAQNSITCSSQILNSSVVIFYAGSSIRLTKGFRVFPGSHFLGQLIGCSPSIKSVSSTPPVSSGDINLNGTIGSSSEELAKESIRIYPNPSNGQVTLTMKGAYISGRVVITNLAGKVVWNKVMDTEVQKIDLTSQPAGVYLVKVTTASNSYNTKLIIK